MLFGPTAAGKTRLVEDLFFDGCEVINADSAQVYRFLDIGTAKPDKTLRSRIPHHLVDIVNPDEQYTVGDFVRKADELVPAIIKRGKLPIVCGGSAYYIKHFAFGLPKAPPSDPDIRNRLKNELARKGKAALYDELCRCDSESASRISSNDTYRLLRALEVLRLTGRPLSSWKIPENLRDYAFLFIGLELSRDELAEKINRRVDMMFEQGLVTEFRDLVERGYSQSDPGMRGIGYQEFFAMMKGCGVLSDVKEAIKLHSRQYAKRQMTFFKRIPDTRWFHPQEKEKIRQYLDEFIKQKQVLENPILPHLKI